MAFLYYTSFGTASFYKYDLIYTFELFDILYIILLNCFNVFYGRPEPKKGPKTKLINCFLLFGKQFPKLFHFSIY